ncbi:hypothetical protein D3C72_1284230 [compost metagenome]
MVGSVVAVLHLEGLGTHCQGHDLVAQADTERGHATVHDLACGHDGVIAGLWVTRAVGQEDTIRLVLEHVGGRGLGRHHGHAAAALGQHAQNIALDAVVVGHHMEFMVLQLAVPRRAVGTGQLPFGLRPLVGLGNTHHLGQIQALHAGGCLGCSDGFVNTCLRYDFTLIQTHDGAILCALVAQQAGELAGVDVGDGNGLGALEVGRQCFGAAEVAGQEWQILDDQACSIDFVGLNILSVDPVVADVRIRECHDLLAVTGVGKDFLIAGHGGVEHHLAGRGALRTNRVANKDRAVCERQDGGGKRALLRQKHWVLRMVTGRPEPSADL